nr:hypothetical protein GCM10020093_005500 [Planobispora longispora]
MIDPATLAEILGARRLPVPAGLVGAAAAAWRMRLVPAAPELFDMLLAMPVMDCSRARDELGWRPRHPRPTPSATCWRACGPWRAWTPRRCPRRPAVPRGPGSWPVESARGRDAGEPPGPR